MKTKLEPGMLVQCDDNYIYLVIDANIPCTGVINLTKTVELKRLNTRYTYIGFASTAWLQSGKLIAKNFELNF